MNSLPMSNQELDALALEADARRGEVMLNSVHRFLGRFIAFPSEHAHTALSLWVVHTHMMSAWDSTPRLACLSPEPGSGKTRVLEAIELLVPNPVCAVNVSPAYLFRKVGSEEGVTILFDEIDTVFGPKAKDNEEIRGLLNAGHRRGAVAGRCVMRGKEVETEEIPAYSAVALAGLGWLPDTIMSRSIIIRMRRRHQGEHVEQFRRRIHAVQGEAIRAAIELWAAENIGRVVWPDLPAKVQDRDADVWEPIVAVADLAGGDWPARARVAAVALLAAAKEAEPSLGVRLLADLRIVFDGADEMASKVILSKLSALEESPWADLRGKPLDERGLAVRLRQYGIKSKTVRIGISTPKGYRRADLHDAWARYLPPSLPRSATSATSHVIVEEFVANAHLNVADVADGPLGPPSNISCKNNGVAAVADVADLAPDAEERAAILQFDAGLSRQDAEAQARAQLARK